MKDYCFILEEGKNIPHDFLDYHLIMVQIQHTEVLKSPPSKKRQTASPLPNLQIIDMTSLKRH